MKTLIVEDEFMSRKLLMKYMSSFSECDIAINGQEAYEAFIEASKTNEPYDLILLDIVMPEMDGQEVLKEIRAYEINNNIFGLDSVKIIMITAMKDDSNIMDAFRTQCEGYIVKPVEKEKLLNSIQELGFDIGE